MIVSKPKFSTLFSITSFEVIVLGLFIYGLLSINEAQDKTWWYVLIYTSGPIGIAVLMKVLFGLKIITIKKEKFSIRFPFKFKEIKFDGKEINTWTKVTIKTYGGIYEELVWQLKSGKKWSVSKQENTEFDKLSNYMSKKFSKAKSK